MECPRPFPSTRGCECTGSLLWNTSASPINIPFAVMAVHTRHLLWLQWNRDGAPPQLARGTLICAWTRGSCRTCLAVSLTDACCLSSFTISWQARRLTSWLRAKGVPGCCHSATTIRRQVILSNGWKFDRRGVVLRSPLGGFWISSNPS
jgi:hypothetical protein